jgi:hypothetical protein
VATHYEDGRYYAAWLDFRLRIYNATRRDSGVYWFRATSPDGADVAQHAVFVDIALVHQSSSVVVPIPVPKATADRSGRKQKKKSDTRKKRTWPATTTGQRQ